MSVDGFEHPVGDRDYIRSGGQITEGRPGGLTFPENGTAPNGEQYGFVVDDATTDGWYSATDHGEYNPDFGGYHLGEDWNSSTGDDLGEPIYAVANGTIVRMGDDGIGLYGQAFGNYIVIRHDMPEGPPVYSFYAHLNEISSDIYTTERGDIIGATVVRGQPIGTMGTTGDSVHPHLHFEMYQGVISTTEEILDERGYSSTARPSGWVDPTDFINSNSVVAGTDEADLATEITAVSGFAPGQTATIEIEIENLGSGDATSALAEIALWNADTDSLVATTLQVQHDAVSGSSSITESVTFNVPDTLGPGTYYFRVEVGRLGNEPDENTSNNFSEFFEVFIGGTGGQGPADLFIQSLSLDNQGVISEGNHLGMDVTVGNQGNSDAPISTVAFYLSDDSVFDSSDVLVDEKTVSGVTSGEVDSTANSIDLTTFSPGTYYLFAVADFDDDVDEGAGESNNTSIGYQVTIEPNEDALSPDLTAENLVLGETTWTVGDEISAVWDILNVGEAEAASTQSTLYLSTDANVTTADVAIMTDADTGTMSSGEVNSEGDGSNGSDPYVVPDSLAPGTYYLAVIADDDNSVSESNETNNASNVVEITVVDPQPDIDLTTSAIGIAPSNPQVGDAVNFSWTITNLGEDTAETAFVTSIYLSTDSTVTTSDRLLVTDIASSGLAAGGLESFNETIIIDGTFAPGEYWVGAIVDTESAIAEVNEANNTLVGGHSFTIEPAPDVSASNLNVMMRTDGSGLYDATFEVTNNGGHLPFGTAVALRLSDDQTIFWEGDYFLGSINTGELASGETVQLEISGVDLDWVLESGMFNPGTHYFAIEADYPDDLEESDEANNVSNLVQIELANPNLTLTGGEEDDALAGEGGNDTLSGESGNDTISAGAGSDSVDGGDGNDNLSGGIGFDTIEGGSGNDTLIGQDGFDSLMGGGGNDSLTGNNGFDLLDGGDGDDTLLGGLGTDTLNGRDGDDLLSGQAGFDLLNGGADNDTVDGNSGADTLNGNGGDDVLNGGINNDVLNGGSGNDTLNAGNGTDDLSGGAGNDRLEGNAGSDRLNGGTGNDVLRGGIGADTFVFDAGSGDDRVADFQNNIDTVELSSALFMEDMPVAGDITNYASLDEDGFVVLTFGDDSLTFTGITNVNALVDDVVLV
ncbi:CARDB domain-containing protein [uncultured Tateyamaria sp.]|uniref:CARDB domain-containing protein n=1 Tax=uncultured Tateyamaria sp. TaxID=455651 RepID=UPI002602B6E1|nr:CARDB domain-containing protein [uncultured Tateyamaria sp.]